MSDDTTQPPFRLPVDRRTWAGVLVAAVAAIVIGFLTQPTRSFAAAPCTVPVTNAVACENSKPGTPPAEWQTQGAGDPSIMGYATSMSVNLGQTIQFKIKTDSSNYHIDILRLGYYNGDGARMVQASLPITASLPQNQPACTDDGTSAHPTGLIDCGNWKVTASWTVPTTMVSGVYIAHLVRDDAEGGDSQIPFVVRNDASHSAMVLQTSDATWQAYNAYGGNSLYSCTVACPPGTPDVYKGASSVSYNRPFDGTIPQDNGRSYLWYAEYQMIRFLEANGYDLSYVASKDVDSDGASLRNHKVFIASGHDEYWSANMRSNVESARDHGVNLAFFTGNEVFWKTRFENAGRTLTTYKETHYNAQIDPNGPAEWTGTWADSRFTPPSDGGNPQNALTGQLFYVNSGTSDIKVPAAFGKLRLWRNTRAASLTGSQSLTLYPGGGALGYEWDIDADNGFRPSGLIRLSSTTVDNVETFTDFGSMVTTGPATHNLTLYKASSGALVFGAGTVQWSWGLDDTNAWNYWITNPSGNPPDRDMQQATVNLFADMGVQPYGLLPGLVSASKSTDTTPPTASISSPSSGSTIADGTQTTITGTATDLGGGQVAGIEVSTDNGATWHPATSGTTSWSYKWTAHGAPTASVRVRATDDSGNIGAASAARTVNITCDCSLFGNVTPPTIDGEDNHGVEVGVKFKTDTFGVVKGIRFYKASTNTGTHVGSLWTADGTRMAQATFQNETSSGWQKVTFATPVAILPNTTYVASYYAPTGHYSVSGPDYFNSPSPYGGTPIDAPPLHAIRATDAAPNGLFSYATESTFPTSSYNATNYYVDVLFAASPSAGQVTGVTATAGPGSATVSWTAPASGGSVTQYTITPYQGATAKSATTITGNPPATTTRVDGLTSGQSYTFRVTASNPNGSGPQSSASNAVTPSATSVPGTPRTVEAAAASKTVKLTWLPPLSDGGLSISGYTVTAYVGSTAQTPVNVAASSTSATLSGLTNGSTYTFQVKAKNALGAGSAATSNAVTPDDTIFDFGTPAIVDSGDGNAVELGVKFKADAFGLITGVRFYKAAANSGTHVGSLWSAAGDLLARATFSNETSSGWQQVRFSTPVTVTPGQTYVVSYYAPAGHYSVTSPGLASGVDNGALHALGSAEGANGVFAYGSAPQFPTDSFNSSNYFVDVTYAAASAPGTVTGVTAAAGSGSAAVSWNAPTTGGPPTKYVITPYIGTSAQASTTVSGSPPATSATLAGLSVGQAYTFRVTAGNPAGNGPASAASNAVTPGGGTTPGAPTNVAAEAGTASAKVSWSAPASTGGWPITGYTVTPYIGDSPQTPVTVSGGTTSTTIDDLANDKLYTFRIQAINQIGAGSGSTTNAVTPAVTIFNLASPASPDSQDGNAVELGVKFRADTFGTITGIRFYKSSLNTGTHVGSLWTAGGTRLAQATFADETASGWQQVKFATPVPVTAGVTYVASYYAPNGHYSATSQAFGSAFDSGSLHALSNSVSDGNGVFGYSTSGGFPIDSFNASNYWVDVTYATAPAPGTPSAVTATSGLNAATVDWAKPASGGPVTQYTVTPYIGSSAQTPTTVTGSPPATTATIGGLVGGQVYTFKVTASNPNGSGPASDASSPVTVASSAAPSAPRDVFATAANGKAKVSWSAPSSTGDAPVTGYTVTPYVGSTSGTPVTTDASTLTATVTGLANGSATTFRVSARSSIGTGPYATSNSATPNHTIFEFGTPATIDSNDGSSVVLGVKFRSDVSGEVTGVRFYKAGTNIGGHVGSLWSEGGSLLASGTFTGESESGWQQVDFASPVDITAGSTYVASYFAPSGHYSVTSNAFSSGFDNAPLHALANSLTPNGVFVYSGTNMFPSDTWNSGNYWVDVLFAPGS